MLYFKCRRMFLGAACSIEYDPLHLQNCQQGRDTDVVPHSWSSLVENREWDIILFSPI